MKKLLMVFVTSLSMYAQSAQIPAGILDRTFGNGGYTTQFITGTTEDSLNSIAYDQFNRILSIGAIYLDGTVKSVVGRALQNGTLDTSFAGIGYVVVNPTPDAGSYANAIMVDSQNRIIAVTIKGNGSTTYSILRFLENGQLDTTFGTDGIVTTTLDIDATVNMYQTILDSQDRVILVGTLDPAGGASQMLVIRNAANGYLDTTFSDGAGYVRISIDGSTADGAFGVITDSSDNIFVSGQTTLEGLGQAIVLKLSSSGAEDISFGTGGSFIHNFSGDNDYAGVMAIDSEGRLLVTGAFYVNTQFSVFRLSASGVLDTTFGNQGGDGYGTYQYQGQTPYTADYIVGITLDAYERIIIMGVGTAEDLPGIFLCSRIVQNGQLDTTFGNQGFASFNIQNSNANQGFLSPAGNIIMCGYITNFDENNNFALVAFTIGYDLNYYEFQFTGQPLGLL